MVLAQMTIAGFSHPTPVAQSNIHDDPFFAHPAATSHEGRPMSYILTSTPESK